MSKKVINMKVISHTLGFPRIGLQRELKKAQEAYWAGNITQDVLLNTGKQLRARHWQQQHNAGVDLLPVGDFAWYDHVLTMSMLLGNIPDRHLATHKKPDLDTLFCVARGCSATGITTTASEMKKWFNTNYHYIVPEFTANQTFTLSWNQLFEEIDEAHALGYQVKPVLIGPLTYLWLGKSKQENFNRLALLPHLLIAYKQIIDELIKRNIRWVQIDEPALVQELPTEWLTAYQTAYQQLHQFSQGKLSLLLTTYFSGIHHTLSIIKTLPIQGLHIDLIYGDNDLLFIHQQLPENWILSLGIINGRNIWRTNLIQAYQQIKPITSKRQLWISSSCSLLHCPLDLNEEKELDEETRSWFAFALQKCQELSLLTQAINAENNDLIKELEYYSLPIIQRVNSKRVNDPQVAKRLAKIASTDSQRSACYTERAKIQQQRYSLPLWPTTTIGSFPQTTEIRALRLNMKRGQIDYHDYYKHIAEQIKQVIREQEQLDIDVLVHGEAERNDMVEYFGEHLTGFIFTQNGWVQSYGSRCVKPPIIIGDISRPKPITIEWSRYAQSLTTRPVKGMLTGPITILCWSFPREDIKYEIIAKQIALALRDEVYDLECAGIGIIQIDEPALREGLPLKRSEWQHYLDWAIHAFKLTSAIAQAHTQIHTHMCYCEFNDIIDAITALDADVITIETARSDMKLLTIFEQYDYPNEIGPGVYDIHSPNIPSVDSMVTLLQKAAKYIPVERLWVNPDCGLKTRTWEETRQSLTNMVKAAKLLRKSNL